jgi:moderate conductance mechanosensitive channel
MDETTAPPLTLNTLEIALALSIVVTLAASVAIMAGTMAKRLLRKVLGETSGDPTTERFVRGTVRMVRIMSFALVTAVLAFPALDMAGVGVDVGLQSQELGEWAARTGVRIGVIIVAAFAIVRVTGAVANRAQHDLSTGTGLDAIERQKRAKTVAGIVRGGLSVMVWTTATLMILRELDMDITPVLTGAGILGLAIGFGAQTLVRDVISGFFLIIEDQVRVGDVAQVNGTGGFVEQINLRTIVLRDYGGVVHVFPNGAITTMANLTKEFSFYVIDLGVDYAEDTDRAVQAVRDAADELMHDPAYAPNILAPLEVAGVDDFADSQVTIKIRIKTVPLKQWEVGRELRRRIKKTFDERGITIPFPQRTLHIVRSPATEDATAAAPVPK